MRNPQSLAALAASAVLALGAPAFGAASDDDASFVKDAASAGMMEVDLGKHVAKNAADPDVRAFGQRMVDDHGKANQELKSVAKREGLAVPTQLDQKQRDELQKLMKLRGAELDKAYMDAMVKDHERDVDAFRKQAEQKKTEVDRWAAKTLPTLEEHLKHAKSVSERVHGSGMGGGGR